LFREDQDDKRRQLDFGQSDGEGDREARGCGQWLRGGELRFGGEVGVEGIGLRIVVLAIYWSMPCKAVSPPHTHEVNVKE
jgi:hypothetical protein